MKSKQVRMIVFAAFSTLLSSCFQTPQQARENLASLGIPYNERGFYSVASNCDALAVNNFLASGMEPLVAIPGAAEGLCPEILTRLINQSVNPVDRLLRRYEDIESHLSAALEVALFASPKASQLATIDILLKAGADPNKISREPALVRAAILGDSDLVKLLINSGVDIEGEGSRALFYAAQKGDFEMVKLLVEQGIDPNASGCPDPDNVDLTRTSCSPLAIAINRNFMDLEALNYIADFLLEQGADPNDGRDGTSIALRNALIRQELDDLSIRLLQSGAIPTPVGDNSFNVGGMMDSIIRRQPANVELIGLLLQNGLDPNAIHTHNQCSLLCIASEDPANREVVELLLDAGAEVNDTILPDDTKGSSALLNAVRQNDPEMVERLLSLGANPLTPIQRGCSLEAYARLNGYSEIYVMIIAKNGIELEGNILDRCG